MVILTSSASAGPRIAACTGAWRTLDHPFTEVEMRVEEIMSKPVATCDYSDSAEHAARIMWEKDVGVLPVLLDGTVVGVVTDRDLAMAALKLGRALGDFNVFEAASAGLWSCDPEDRVLKAERIMAQHQVRRLPVMDGDHVVGMISLNDLARAAAHFPRDVTHMELSRTLGAICEPRALPASL